MKYKKKLTVKKLVLNDYFRKWVNNELPPSDQYWERWIQDQPDLKPVISKAMLIVKALRMNHESMDQKKMEDNVHRIMMEAGTLSENKKSILTRYQWMASAAVLILMAGVAWYVLIPRTTESEKAASTQAAQQQGTPMVEKINNSDQPVTVSLSDGSEITLQPQSKLTYPLSFPSDKREVILNGEGYFDIARNPERPFFVLAGDIITKVLGTRFSVKALDNDDDITVRVTSGKVSVLPLKQSVSSHKSHQPEGIILSSNQMAVYARRPEKLTRSLVENPEIIKTPDYPGTDNIFNFMNEPVSGVFAVLEKSYGVNIVYDAGLLQRCTVTAPLENESLFEKLALICKAINASYEVIDAQIVISAKGCI